jgi:hypothetical protein
MWHTSNSISNNSKLDMSQKVKELRTKQKVGHINNEQGRADMSAAGASAQGPKFLGPPKFVGTKMFSHLPTRKIWLFYLP